MQLSGPYIWECTDELVTDNKLHGDSHRFSTVITPARFVTGHASQADESRVNNQTRGPNISIGTTLP